MDVNDVLVFVRVVQAGSFSRAAKRLNMPVSTVSRRVAELEGELGVPLLMRTTRSLRITDVGQAYFEHGVKIATEMELAESIATNLQSIPQGTLKITAASDFGNKFLGKIVCDYLKINPRVKAEIVLTDRVVDLVAEGFDLAIRMGELSDSSLVAKKIGSLNMQLYASPAFVKQYGEPTVPADLSKFECIRFTGDEDSDEWMLKSQKGEKSVKVSGRVSTNDMALLRSFVLAGEGIAFMPHFLCADDVKSGKLKILMKDWALSYGAISVVYPGQRFLLPKVRAFVDHLTRSCADVEWRRQQSKKRMSDVKES